MVEATLFVFGVIMGMGLMCMLRDTPYQPNITVQSMEPFGNTSVHISRWKVKYSDGKEEKEVVFPMIMNKMEHPDRKVFHRYMARQAALWQEGAINEYNNLA